MALIPTHHSDIEVVAGDQWSIDGQLLDRNGQPLDLTNAAIQWSLRDPDGLFMPAVVQATTVTVDTDPTTGKINISVPNGTTWPLTAGRYHDSVRVIVEGSYIDTVWVGLLLVDANPFELDAPPPVELVIAGDDRDITPAVTTFTPKLIEADPSLSDDPIE